MPASLTLAERKIGFEFFYSAKRSLFNGVPRTIAWINVSIFCRIILYFCNPVYKLIKIFIFNKCGSTARIIFTNDEICKTS